jgi:hypothetical protein
VYFYTDRWLTVGGGGEIEGKSGQKKEDNGGREKKAEREKMS